MLLMIETVNLMGESYVKISRHTNNGNYWHFYTSFDLRDKDSVVRLLETIKFVLSLQEVTSHE